MRNDVLESEEKSFTNKPNPTTLSTPCLQPAQHGYPIHVTLSSVVGNLSARIATLLIILFNRLQK